MTIQLNLKFQDAFLEKAKHYADEHGYMSVQELIREALRDKIDQEYDVRPEYIEFLKKNKQANTFVSEAESVKFDKLMEDRAQLE